MGSNGREMPLARVAGSYILRFFCCISFFIFPGGGESEEIFDPGSFSVKGRTLALIPADLDGTAPAEIIVVRRTGVYPGEQRWITIFRADAQMDYGPAPWQDWAVDKDATMFEVGDVSPSPGKEIFFLTPKGIRFYAREKDGFFNTASRLLLSMDTATVFPAPGFLPRSRLLSDWGRNGQKMMLVPRFGSFSLFKRNQNGVWSASHEIFTRPRTFLYGDQEDDGILKTFSLRMDYRMPRVFSRDFNGDGRADLVLTEQESVFVYLQTREGHFAPKPSVSVQLPGRDSVKGPDWNHYFLAIPVEINKDGYSDMILTLAQSAGGFLERKVEVFIFLNQGVLSRPFSDCPDQTITFSGITPGVFLADVNKDGLQDILFPGIELGFWNTVKSLISKSADLHTAVYLFQENHRFSRDPDFYAETAYRLDLTHGVRFNGIWPSLEGDFDADGYPDLLIARDGKIRIYQTRRDRGLFSQAFEQAGVVTCPFKHVFDLNGDGLDDLILYEKKTDGQVSILINKGAQKEISYPKIPDQFEH